MGLSLAIVVLDCLGDVGLFGGLHAIAVIAREGVHVGRERDEGESRDDD